jgi:hypothetical protein
MNRFGTLHRDQRGDLATERRIWDSVTQEPFPLGRSKPHRTEAKNAEKPSQPDDELCEALRRSFHRLPPVSHMRSTGTRLRSACQAFSCSYAFARHTSQPLRVEPLVFVLVFDLAAALTTRESGH